jgi:hypothetical protein
MNQFADDIVSLIRSLDPSRPVSSGYAIPRSAAMHLMRKPGFAPGGPDFTPDTLDEFAKYLTEVHKPFEIISVHVYRSQVSGRFGRPPSAEAELVADAAAAARAAGKSLFVGEFGDSGVTPFMTGILDEIVRNRVQFAAVWVWEFYQTSTYRTHDTEPTKYSIEPAYPNGVISLLTRTESTLGVPPPTSDGVQPRVVLTWPLPCATVDGPVELHAVASAGSGPVKNIEFLVDSRPVGSSATFPYTVRFDPVGLSAGTVEIDARTTSTSGATADFKSPVRLNGTDAPCNSPAR